MQLGVQGRAAWGFRVCHSKICASGTNADPWLLSRKTCNARKKVAWRDTTELIYTCIITICPYFPSHQIQGQRTLDIFNRNKSIGKCALRVTINFLGYYLSDGRFHRQLLIAVRLVAVDFNQEASFNVAFSSRGNEENTVDSTFFQCLA